MRTWRAMAAIVGLVLVAAGCTSLPTVEPTVDDVRLRVASTDDSGMDLVFDVDVQNPYLSSLHDPWFRYALEVDGRTLASGRRAAGPAFPVAGSGTVSIPVRLGYHELAAAVTGLSAEGAPAYRLTGEFTVPFFGGSLDLPFESRGTLPELR